MIRVDRPARFVIATADPDLGQRLCAALTDGATAAARIVSYDDLVRRDVDADAVFIDIAAQPSRLACVEALRDPRRPRVPVIVAAGRDELTLLSRALVLGADDFVTHPVDPGAVALRFRARMARGVRSASFTPVSLRAVGGEADGSTGDAFCPTCEGVVAAHAAVCPHCASPPPDDGWPPTSASGRAYLGATLAGRYWLDRFVGAGSIGEVYRAVDLFLRRPYAAKVVALREHRADARALVEREAGVLARIDSPHVVRVFELHELEQDRVLLVSDFVDGATLERLVARGGPLRPTRALDLVRQVAQGLSSVHDAGMVHRDVKPSNLIVQELPAGGCFVRIVDFGLVRIRGVLERDGVYGTPAFAAPEQLVAGREVDHRADVYALGLVLMYALTGVAPAADSVDELARARVAAPGASPLLERAIERLPGVAALGPLVLAMTEPDPRDRPADMHDVVVAIDQLSAARADTNAWRVV